MHPVLAKIVETVVLRKVADKFGATVDNAVAPSTAVGATTAAGAVLMPEEILAAIPPEYQLAIRGILLILGAYLMITEQKPRYNPFKE
jgi:3-oxoacyl-ACP reductase-like protein